MRDVLEIKLALGGAGERAIELAGGWPACWGFGAMTGWSSFTVPGAAVRAGGAALGSC